MVISTIAIIVIAVVAAGLVRRRPAFYDPAVSDGQILVGVEEPADPPTVERVFGPDVRRL